jgi:putative nucleotidyltransferase with HDIG domain
MITMALFARHVSYLEEVQITNQEILTRLRDAQTGERGYILTGNPIYLGPFHGSREDISQKLLRLRELTQDNESLDKIEEGIAKEFDFLERSIELRKVEGFQVAQIAVNSGHGKKFMDIAVADLTKWDKPLAGRLNRLGFFQAAVFGITVGALFISIFIAFLVSKQWLIVSKSQLLEQQKAIDQALGILSDAQDMRDSDVGGHAKKAECLAVRMAEIMGINGEERENISRGALLHDVGKIGIPDRILQKPGKFEADEWEIMKTHVEIGYNMLNKVPFLWPALKIVGQHHEKFDGTGYPLGIKGDQIDIGARIFMVADAFDAMTSERPYKTALPTKTAMMRLCEDSGRHFDPVIVKLFIVRQADILPYAGYMAFPDESIPRECLTFLDARELAA